MAGITREERERRRRLLEAGETSAPNAEETLKAYNRKIDTAHITAADVIALHRPARIPGKETVMTGTEARTQYDAITSGKLESRHWPGLFYSPADPEPLQDNMLGTKDAVWRAWFERNGGNLS